jgi:hypothetical protein
MPEIGVENIAERFPADKFSLHAESESREDAEARRRESAEEAKHKRRKNFIVTMFAIGMVGAIFIAALCSFETGSADDKKWAYGIMSTIGFSLVGFLVGKETK